VKLAKYFINSESALSSPKHYERLVLCVLTIEGEDVRTLTNGVTVRRFIVDPEH
jgi:hypothetical protein